MSTLFKDILVQIQVAGQIWIPAVTVFIGAFTIAAVGIFQNSIALGFSYGVCVSTLVRACMTYEPI